MSIDAFTQLTDSYEAIELGFPVCDGPPALADAVQFQSNRQRPVHRWFHFKEGFSADLLGGTGIDLGPLTDESAIFLDPFAGCGTTLVAGDLKHGWLARRVGVEINPFLAFVARAKAQWRRYDPERLGLLAAQVLAEPLREDRDPTTWPSLSTMHNGLMFASERVSALLDLVERVKGITEPERDLLLLGVAAAAERVSFYRKDGRALRILRGAGELEERGRQTVRGTVERIWSGYEFDLRCLAAQRQRGVGPVEVVLGDGRSLDSPAGLGLSPKSVYLAAYSPPYLNHIDYTEVYKVELWLLGFVHEQAEMLELRKGTMRSHASIGVVEARNELVGEARIALDIASWLVSSTGKPWHRAFPALARAYLWDMKRSLCRQYELLQPGGRSVCVVANSAHGSGGHRVPVAVDLFIASLAEQCGFEVERFIIARQLKRRDHVNRFLRETVLVLRRSDIE